MLFPGDQEKAKLPVPITPSQYCIVFKGNKARERSKLNTNCKRRNESVFICG